jgi:hypothetical protein
MSCPQFGGHGQVAIPPSRRPRRRNEAEAARSQGVAGIHGGQASGPAAPSPAVTPPRRTRTAATTGARPRRLAGAA